jgi:adenine deaminase
MNTSEFIQRLPKAELHLHLEGAIPWDMIRDYADMPLPEIPQWYNETFRYTDFDQFTGKMELGIKYVLSTTERYQAAARRIFEGLADQNARYIEISFGANLVPPRGLSVADVTAAIREAAPDGVHVAVIAAFNRAQSHALNDALVQDVLHSSADGIDLHGKEWLGSAEPYAAIFDLARERGFMTRAHAGELLGAESVWEVLRHLKVKRIEHGTRATEDAALVDYIASEGITLDMCPTSNWKLRVVDDLAVYPIKQYFERGIPVTVSTDDPAYFGCTLNGELAVLVERMGFTLAELAEVQKNAFRVAKISEGERKAIFAEIDGLVEELKL